MSKAGRFDNKWFLERLRPLQAVHDWDETRTAEALKISRPMFYFLKQGAYKVSERVCRRLEMLEASSLPKIPVRTPHAMLSNRSGDTFFQVVKAAYHRGDTDLRKPPIMAGENPLHILAVFACFAPYMRCMGESLYTESEWGVGRITAISEEGIRVEYCVGKGKGDSEWIHMNMIGNMDATPRKMKLMHTPYEQHTQDTRTSTSGE